MAGVVWDFGDAVGYGGVAACRRWYWCSFVLELYACCRRLFFGVVLRLHGINLSLSFGRMWRG
ncbi:unnamed protein product [Rhodiola kirilowii]